MSILKVYIRIFLSIAAPATLMFTLICMLAILLPWYRQSFTATTQLHNEMSNHGSIANSVIAYVLYGQPIIFSGFSVREQLHLIDIRNLVIKVEAAFLFTLILLICSLTFLLTDIRRSLYYVLHQSFLWSTLLSLSIAIIVSLNFSALFELFHQSTFNNEYWQLDPNYEVLIVLFPPQLFYILILLTLGGFSILSGLFSWLFYQHIKHA